MSNGVYGVNEQLVILLLPLFKKYDVKLYISGHDHNLQHIIYKHQNYIFTQIICGSSGTRR